MKGSIYYPLLSCTFLQLTDTSLALNVGKFASYLFKHPDFVNGVSGIKSALSDVIERMEQEVIRGRIKNGLFYLFHTVVHIISHILIS